MRILTKENARELLSGESLDSFIGCLSSELPIVEGAYAAPMTAGAQIALAKLFAFLLVREAPLCLYITGWGIATEHLDLFDGYRRSLGDNRPLIQAPVHVFEQADEEALISLLCLVFFFSWDASAFDLTECTLLQTSHDGWLEVRGSNGAFRKEVAGQMQNHGLSLLAR